MPWVLSHDMFEDDSKEFGFRHRELNKVKNSKGMLNYIAYLDFIYEDELKQHYKVQYCRGRKGLGPLPVFYFHKVDDDAPPILEYGNMCPTRDWLHRFRAAHGGRREMWYPADPWAEESKYWMPRKAIYAKQKPASMSLDHAAEVSARERPSALTIQEEPDAEE